MNFTLRPLFALALTLSLFGRAAAGSSADFGVLRVVPCHTSVAVGK